jgi:hypothetical protein
LADLLYVIYGTAVSYGVGCPDTFAKPWRRPVEAFTRHDVLVFGRSVLPLIRRVCDAMVMAPSTCGAALTTLAAEVSGAGEAWGFPMRELFKDVHRSNMSKTFAPGGVGATGAKYGVVNSKGPGYSPPRVVEILQGAREGAVKG